MCTDIKFKIVKTKHGGLVDCNKCEEETSSQQHLNLAKRWMRRRTRESSASFRPIWIIEFSKIICPLSKNPLGLKLFELKRKRKPGTDQYSLEARGRMGEPRTDLEKFQVVKGIKARWGQGTPGGGCLPSGSHLSGRNELASEKKRSCRHITWDRVEKDIIQTSHLLTWFIATTTVPLGTWKPPRTVAWSRILPAPTLRYQDLDCWLSSQNIEAVLSDRNWAQDLQGLS